MTTVIVQVYLIWRVGKLMTSDSKLQTCAVLFVPYLGVIVGFGGSLWTAFMLITVPLVGNEAPLRGSAIISIASSAVTDILIAAAYVWKLVSLKRGHDVDRTSQGRSRSMISRLVYGSIKTGSATATVSVLALVLFLAVLSIQGPLRMLLADNGSGFSSLPGISTVNTALIFSLVRFSSSV